ncbi:MULTISPECIES: molybdate ABC transporter substrate-binding protein [Streptomyces]|uniref:Molybdate ABC transporter substrate-binding protein n=1 Tax=Streptomyces luteosporeus TaxID=173856 RepID=A0ABP6GGJ7_9ACTN
MNRTRTALAAALLVSLTAACSSTGEKETTVTVLAAASLTDVFKQAQAAYEKSHPGTKLTFSFAGSQELAAQVRQGVPADALVTADTKTMDGLKGSTTTPVTIARNKLTIVTTPGNPKNIHTLADLARPDLKVVLAAPEVPAGRYSKKILDSQHITVEPVSQEANVRAVLSKVSMKEADAGIVYETDAKATKTTTVEIPASQNAVALYPAATLKKSEHTKQADDFVKWLTSDEAQQLLRKAGFQQP